MCRFNQRCRAAPDFTALADQNVWASLRPDLKGAGVNILYVLRPSALRDDAPIQNRGHQLFWEQLVPASGGVIEGIEPL